MKSNCLLSSATKSAMELNGRVRLCDLGSGPTISLPETCGRKKRSRLCTENADDVNSADIKLVFLPLGRRELALSVPVCQQVQSRLQCVVSAQLHKLPHCLGRE